ncbi:hypothetical protein L0Z72_14010 [candidate division KSB1 bacterium]|nr:hypothetical protein [candidate division KSB1 bacterium]
MYNFPGFNNLIRESHRSIVHHHEVDFIRLKNFVKDSNQTEMLIEPFLFVEFVGNKNAKIKVAQRFQITACQTAKGVKGNNVGFL